jgi:hypothetical protein
MTIVKKEKEMLRCCHPPLEKKDGLPFYGDITDVIKG